MTTLGPDLVCCLHPSLCIKMCSQIKHLVVPLSLTSSVFSQAFWLFKLCLPLAPHSAHSHSSWRLILVLATDPLLALQWTSTIIFGSLEDHPVDLTDTLCSAFTSSIPSCQGAPFTHSPAGQLSLQVDQHGRYLFHLWVWDSVPHIHPHWLNNFCRPHHHCLMDSLEQQQHRWGSPLSCSKDINLQLELADWESVQVVGDAVDCEEPQAGWGRATAETGGQGGCHWLSCGATLELHALLAFAFLCFLFLLFVLLIMNWHGLKECRIKSKLVNTLEGGKPEKANHDMGAWWYKKYNYRNTQTIPWIFYSLLLQFLNYLQNRLQNYWHCLPSICSYFSWRLK